MIRSLLVYCGSAPGNSPAYSAAAVALGELLVKDNITLVYGGGSVGLMGVLADTVLRAGGKVEGVIPDFLHKKEVGHHGLTKLHVVHTMHERKAKMESLCDAVVALPGGFGTMDELFEILTWGQLGLHRKPVGLLNQNGFYDAFLAQLDKMVEEGFLKKSNRDVLVVADTPAELLDLLQRSRPAPGEPWMKRGQE